MVLIHLSGTPGSGKTTLGKKLKKIFSTFKIIETDGFVSDKDRKARDTLKTNNEKNKYISDIYKKQFDKYNKKYKNIIYVGILNSSMVNNNLYSGQQFNYKIFLEIPEIELIKRYYSREIKRGLITKNSYIKKVINEYPILGSKELLNYYEMDKTVHVDMGYIPLNNKEIIKKIKNISID